MNGFFPNAREKAVTASAYVNAITAYRALDTSSTEMERTDRIAKVNALDKCNREIQWRRTKHKRLEVYRDTNAQTYELARDYLTLATASSTRHMLVMEEKNRR